MNIVVGHLSPNVELKINKGKGRQRQVWAKIQIPRTLASVWQVLTDYEAFPTFMPIVAQSRRLETMDGSICLEQVRVKTFLGMKIAAHSVFSIIENFPHEIHYQLIEGDFQSFTSQWQLEAVKLSDGTEGVNLVYQVSVLPKRIFPVALVEQVLSQDVPASLLAICQRVEERF
jgi:ribosome-associated toxin RatA of RatAB toxin-antitoxin module